MLKGIAGKVKVQLDFKLVNGLVMTAVDKQMKLFSSGLFGPHIYWIV